MCCIIQILIYFVSTVIHDEFKHCITCTKYVMQKGKAVQKHKEIWKLKYFENILSTITLL
jgi:hypothetical protein